MKWPSSRRWLLFSFACLCYRQASGLTKAGQLPAFRRPCQWLVRGHPLFYLSRLGSRPHQSAQSVGPHLAASAGQPFQLSAT